MPAVSVIVPVYNVESFLKQCVDSLRDQTLEDLEIILVNDGSKDESGELADRLASTDSRITVIHQENAGLSAARNTGIQRATGDFVGFVDSDDWVERDMFQKMFQSATEFDAEVVVCGMSKHFQDGRINRLGVRKDGVGFGVSARENPEILYNSRSYACNKIFARRFFASDGYRFPEGRHFEDSAVVYNILADANRVTCVPDSLYNYRFMRSGSITSQVGAKIFDVFLSCDDIIRHFTTQGFMYGSIPDQLERIVRNHIVVRIDQALELPDRKIARKFVRTAFDYLDRSFPGWSSRYVANARKNRNWKQRARRSRYVSYSYIYTPRKLREGEAFLRIVSALLLLAHPKEFLVRTKTRLSDLFGTDDRQAQTQATLVEEFGADVLVIFDRIATQLDLEYFADFGTLLRLVRDGRFVGDDDIDLGVIGATLEQQVALRPLMAQANCTLYRRYTYRDVIREESYWVPVGANKSDRIKLDISYYDSDENSSWTYLFYRDPTMVYRSFERSVVRMSYSPIKNLATHAFDCGEIPIPANAEDILAQKYGPDWRTPDSNWVYWRTPASEYLDTTVFYLTGARAPMIPEGPVLSGLQEEQLRVLEECERVFGAHGLRYFLAEGSLLGAVRHHGYIPWDDDIDIAMPREDYEEFVELAEEELGAGFRLWGPATDSDYHLPFVKVVSTDQTRYYNPDTRIPDEMRGPRVDIFPVDRVDPSAGVAVLRRAQRMRFIRDAMLVRRGFGIGRRSRAWKRGVHLVSGRLSIRFLQNLLRSLATEDNSSLRSTLWVNYASSYPIRKQAFPSEWILPLDTELTYEGELRPVPSQPDKVLSKIYNEYETMPPYVKRTRSAHGMAFLPMAIRERGR